MKKTVIALIAVIMTACALLCACDGGVLTQPLFGGRGVEFSEEGGLYSEPFTLYVKAPGRTVVRYTTDGSRPTAESDVFPNEGIEIKDRSNERNVLASISASNFTKEEPVNPPKVAKGTVVRAAAFNKKGEIISETAASYFVGLDYGVKVVSLVTDKDNLFDKETGIYVLGKSYDDWYSSTPGAASYESWEIEGNFSQKGKEWERPVHVDVINADGSMLFGQDMGIRIMGAASRRYYQKSFRLYAREEYGEKNVKYPLISGAQRVYDSQPLEKYKTFLLRNGGNDVGSLIFRDRLIQKLVEDRSFTTQASEPAVVFINGEYWGLYAITEDYSDNYIQNKYGIDKDNVAIIKTFELEEGTPEDLSDFNEINDAMYGKSFTKKTSYDWLCSRVDIQSMIDIMAVYIYTANGDGIFDGNNWRMWHACEPDDSYPWGDGRWRFMLYDTEFALSLYGDGSEHVNNTLEDVMNRDWGFALLFRKLMQNSEFRCQFVNSCLDMRNTVFTPDYANALLDEMYKQYKPLITDQVARNGPEWVNDWYNAEDFFLEQKLVVQKFINGRYSSFLRHLSDTLGLRGKYRLTVSVNDAEGGTVTVNTVTPDLSGGSWHGDYFSECPVTLTAAAADGWRFTGWSGADKSDSNEITVAPDGDIELTANFEKI